jgi:hypothetical protein
MSEGQEKKSGPATKGDAHEGRAVPTVQPKGSGREKMMIETTQIGRRGASVIHDHDPRIWPISWRAVAYCDLALDGRSLNLVGTTVPLAEVK